jgi:hypothetical protein
MKKYIIEYKSRFNGEDKTTYHSEIKPTNKYDMALTNVYTESVVTDKKKAKVFWEFEEASKVSKLFANEFHIPTIITF